MPVTIPRSAYAHMFGPTTGDRIRLADTDLVIAVENLGNNTLLQTLPEQLHHVDLTEDSRDIAEPRIGRAQLRPRLLEHEALGEGLHA